MKTIFRKVGKARFLGPAVMVAVALVLISNLAYAYTTSNLGVLQKREDRFYNYDFLAGNAALVENFEWGVDGDSLSKSAGLVKWTVSTSGSSKVEIDTAQKHEGTRSGKWYYNKGLAEASFTCSPVQSYEFSYRRDGGGLSVHRHGDATHRIDLGIFWDGAIKYWDTQWRDTGYAISDNTWYRLAIRNIDWTAHTYDIYLNGALIKSGTPMQAYGGSNGIIAFLNSGANSFWIDDILVKESSSTGVSCAATMVFYNNAWVNKVKNMYYGMADFASTDYALLNDGSGWIWDSDRGTKTRYPFNNPVYLPEPIDAYVLMHLRVYAPNPPDYMYNASWGKYVVGTTHCDEFPEYLSVPWQTWHGYHEVAEEFFADWASDDGYAVFEDWTSFYNEEDFRVDVQPDGYICIWENNGYATAVYVP